MKTYRDKIKPLEELRELCRNWKEAGETIVFTNGCFDLLHPGHVRYLEKARALGDRLIVGLNSDQSVARIKGPNRPIMDERSRAEVLAALSFPSAIVIFEQDTPYRVIEELQPHVLVKGGDWAPHELVGAEIVQKAGGKVEVIPYLEGFSTTSIISKILKAQRGG